MKKQVSTLTGTLFILWFIISPILGVFLVTKLPSLHIILKIIVVVFVYVASGFLFYLLAKKVADKNKKKLIEDVEEKGKIEKESLAKNSTHWMFWWIIEDQELEHQVQEYSNLKITKSAKGQATLMFLFSGVLSLAVLLFLHYDTGIVDIALFFLLAFFIYKGKKWAMITGMILWTLEKGYTLFSPVTTEYHTNYVVTLLWWSVYLHALWLAYNVEKKRNAREETVVTDTINQTNI